MLLTGTAKVRSNLSSFPRGQPSKIVFRDTQALLGAAKQAIATGTFLETFFDRKSFVSEDQVELLEQIREAFSHADEYEMTPLLDLLLRYAEYDSDPEPVFEDLRTR